MLRLTALVLLGYTLSVAASAQDAPPKGFSSIEILWPEGAPGAHGKAEGDVPRLYCFPAPGAGVHPAVIVMPGGGYLHLVFEKEGAAEARWLNERGVSAYVLQYRLAPAYVYPAPMQDGERAVRFVRAHAKAWHVKPEAIGVWGFSAGGHLAGYLATSVAESQKGDAIDAVSERPDFAIISYGRLSLDPAIPGTFGMKALLGDHPTQADTDAISPVLHVSKDSSPTFLYATERDEKVNSLNATLFFNALQKAGVSAELHVFEQGPHGTGMGDKYPELAIWPLLLEHWMQLHGWVAARP